MRSEAMQRLDALVGRWRASMHQAWFLPEPDVENAGIVVVDWWSDAFVTFHWHADGADLQMVFGHSGADNSYHALYHDERGTDRLFAMTFDGATWRTDYELVLERVAA